MEEAFALAERGRGSTHPNPLVGAVLVKDGEVVGRGWHLAPGEPHAEAIALAEAGERARGATLYCTLEPCSHHGKTPPCADALVAAGVARAVIALGDPNPQVDGRGLRKLREGGVEVELAGEAWAARAREQNAPFLKFHRTGLPLVTYKAAITLDGKVAAAGGDARWISCLDSRRAVHELRVARRRRAWSAPARCAATTPSSPCGWPTAATRCASWSRTTATSRPAPRSWRRRSTRAPSSSPTEATDATRRLLQARGAELLEVGDGGLRGRPRGARRTGPPRHPLRGRPHARRRAARRRPHRPRAAVRGAAHRRARRARPVRGARRHGGRRRLAAAGRHLAAGLRRPAAQRHHRAQGRLTVFTGIAGG